MWVKLWSQVFFPIPGLLLSGAANMGLEQTKLLSGRCFWVRKKSPKWLFSLPEANVCCGAEESFNPYSLHVLLLMEGATITWSKQAL